MKALEKIAEEWEKGEFAGEIRHFIWRVEEESIRIVGVPSRPSD